MRLRWAACCACGMANAQKQNKKTRPGARKHSREDVNAESGANRTRRLILRRNTRQEK